MLRARDPRRTDARRQLPERGLQRPRVAAVRLPAVAGEHRAVGPHGQQPLGAVVQPQRGGAETAAHRTGRAPGPSGLEDGQGQQPVRPATAEPHEQPPHPVTGPRPRLRPGGARQGGPGACGTGAHGTGVRGTGQRAAVRPPQPSAAHPVASAVGACPAQELGACPARELPPAPLEQRRQMVDHAVEHHRPPARQVGAVGEPREDPVVLREHVEGTAASRAGEDGTGVRGPGPRPVVASPPAVHAHPVQRGDRLRRQEHRVRPRRVAVPARREQQELPFEEVPPVRLVPHHRRQRQQAGTVLRTEGGHRPVPGGEPVGERVGHLLARPQDVGVPVEQQVRFLRLLQPDREGVQRARRQAVVPVQQEDVVPARPRQPGVARRAGTGRAREVERHDPGVPGGELVDDRPAGVR